MSTDITKKQHYIWRRYLNPWKNNPDDKQIWTGFIQTREVKKVALMGVGQSSFFYKFEVLTNEELDFLKSLTGTLSEATREIAYTILAAYVIHALTNDAINSGKIEMNPNLEHELKKIEAGSFENIQSQIELMGDKLLDCSSIKDVEELAEEDEYEFLLFMMVQYTRTKAMKDRFVASLSERKHLQSLAEKSWPFYNIVLALQIVESMVMKKDYRFVFINNKGSIPFITGDQPIINARGNIKDEQGFAKELEFYYPLSPLSALVIDFTPGDKFSEIDVSDDYVKDKNELIKNEAELHLFANDEAVLKGLFV